MNIKKIFEEKDQKSFLDSAKSSFLERLEKGSKEVIDLKDQEIREVSEEREKLLIKISAIGQSETLEKLDKAKSGVDPESLGRDLMDLVLQEEILQKEKKILETKLAEMFSDPA
jgi:hypothetical protein